MTRAGIQISSVRKFLQTPEDVLASFWKVSEIGYRTIQIQWISPAVPADFIRAALQETQLECVGTQDYYDEVVSHLDEVVENNNLWGGRYICVSGIPDRYRSYEGCLAFGQELNRLSEDLEKSGKILNFHPRFMDILPFAGQNSLDVILQTTRDQVQFVLDVYHLVKAGLDPADWIYRVKDRGDLIHFKDVKINPDGSEALVPVGQGSIIWNNIFQACRDTGVKYGFAEQESWQKDPFECLRESYTYITTNGIEK
jgi:sugar phosphate isomerase/epimerase